MRTYPLEYGEAAPWFIGRTRSNPAFSFDSIGGRHVILFFFESSAQPAAQAAIDGFIARREWFDDANLCFFGVSADPQDEFRPELADQIPGIRYFWDGERTVSSLYGVVGPDGYFCNMTYVLDPMLRVVARVPLETAVDAHLQAVGDAVQRLAPVGTGFNAAPQAPVLVIPRIFEAELCARLIEYYDTTGGRDSGFMRDIDGKTVQIIDYGHKRRRDCTIEEGKLRNLCMRRIHDRLAPQVHKAFQFMPTRMERYIVACYDESERGHFRPHRDNTTKGTAHRRFAVSLFLNSGEYDGGCLRFPEFGPALYTAPQGGAVVFSCSLLHEATPVTRGRRLMFLPFLYDDQARRIREENLGFLDEVVASSIRAGMEEN
jgi:predicted 2-oxoglutarate/Fe(II)-dependent dioxygenase YbiX/peroxiredoxin